MFHNKSIVFGFNHINSLGIVRSLGEKNISPICVLYGPKVNFIYKSKYPSKIISVINPYEGLEYILQYYTKEQYKPVIICSNDLTASIIDKNFSKLKDYFYLPNAKYDGAITFLMNKSNISNLASKLGFAIPQSIIINKKQKFFNNVIYPCITKSLQTISGGKKDVFLCNNKKELEIALTKVESQEILVQQYINKKNEICLQGVSINGGKQIYIPYIERFFRFTKNEFGGYVYFTKFEKEKLNFIDKIKSLLQETNYSGLFSVEFLLDLDDNLYFTEINFRHDGFSYFTTVGGANLPFIWFNSIISDKLMIDDIVLKEEFTGMNELTDFFQFVRTGQISIFKWFIECLKADSYLLYNKDDIKPFIYLILEYAKIFFKKYILKR